MFSPYAAFQKFTTPFCLAHSFTRTGYGRIHCFPLTPTLSRKGRGSCEFLPSLWGKVRMGGDWFDHRRRHCLYCEWAGHPCSFIINKGLVVECLPRGRFVVGYGFQSNVWYSLVFKTAANTFVGVGKLIIIE